MEENKKSNKNKVSNFIKNNNKWLIPLILIIIAMSISTHFRMYSNDLPITEEWAESSVMSMYKNQVTKEINEKYPSLPDVNKQKLINERIDDYTSENKVELDKQIQDYSEGIKKHFQYEDSEGDSYTYLLAIDPYLWYGYGENYLECGHQGCLVNEDGEYQNLRNGRNGKLRDMAYISLLGVGIYKVANFLPFTAIPLMQAFFLIPVLLIGLAIIPAFFLGKKMGGNVGGFFAGIIVAINAALLTRTPAGFSDTDSANVIFPLFIAWFFIEAFYSDTWKKTTLYSVLGGITFFLYSKFWITTHMFGFLIAAVGLYLIFNFAAEYFKHGKLHFNKIWKGINKSVYQSIIFLGISLIFLILDKGFKYVINIVKQPFNFLTLKEVGMKSIWPNVLTTVAEFNTIPLNQIIGQMGGIVLFSIAILGLVLSAVLKDKKGKRNILFSFLIIVWFLGTGYAFTKGSRFAILMVPAFAIAFGTGVGIIHGKIGKWMSKEFKISKLISSVIIIAIVLVSLIYPIQDANGAAKSKFPSYNDAWDNSLSKIKADAGNETGYITTWWDFGHWFVANGISVTFDGGDQGERIHWVGKALLTENEDLSVGIVRMLNCGQQQAPHILEKYLEDDTIKAVKILDQIVVLDKEGATTVLQNNGLSDEAIQEVLETTHCDDLLPQYVIASEDMVGKSGVWGHFGSWDFERALMFQTVKSQGYEKGISTLKTDFNLSDELASKYYNQIQVTEGDRWISEWPSYSGSLKQCSYLDIDNVQCVISVGQQIPIKINLVTHEATINAGDKTIYPNALVYMDGKNIVKKEFSGDKLGVSIILIKEGSSYYVQAAQPAQAYSMFTRLFFFGGHGLKYYKPFNEDIQITGDKIVTYKVDWESEKETNLNVKEEVLASHILISTDNRTDEEALAKATEILFDLTPENFAGMAQIFSEGPSAVNGGSLGWFGKGQMVKEFEDIAFSIGKGKISRPVKTQFGYHIILVEDKRTDE